MIKYIRECRSMTKKDIYEGIMSAAAYDKVENDFNKIRLEDLMKIIERLDLTQDEFFYFSFNEVLTSPFKKLRSINDFFQQKDIINLLNEDKSYNKYDYTLKTIYFMSIDQIDMAKKSGIVVWNILKKYDELFAFDLFCLSHIFPLFEEEIFEQINNKLMKNFKKWRNFDEFYRVEIIYLLNAGRYFQELNNNVRAIRFYEKAYKLSLFYRVGDYTGVSLYRLGYLKNDEDILKQGITLLELFDPMKLDVLKKD